MVADISNQILPLNILEKLKKWKSFGKKMRLLVEDYC